MARNFLNEIVLHKHEEVEAKKNILSVDDLKNMIRGAHDPLSLSAALTARPEPVIIAEIKKASPSEGVIREDFDPVELARDYVANHAAAISVLTDEDYFLGSIAHLNQVRPVADVPLLRKDFIIDEYQIHESRAFGADAVLLIVAMLGRPLLKGFLQIVADYGMEALVEVHDENELDIAMAMGAKIIGINNRDLQTFKVDLRVTEKLVRHIGEGYVVVAESGIATREDIIRMYAAHVDGLLVGSHFMRQKQPGQELARFHKEIQQCCG